MKRFLSIPMLLSNSPRHAGWILAMLLPILCTRSQAERILLIGAEVHTLAGPVLNPGQVLMEGTQILEVGARIEAKDATVTDLTGLRLYPGLIAASTSLGLTEISAVRATRDSTEVGRFNPDVQSWVAINPDSELIPVARANGIAHAVPVPQGGLVSGQSALMALDGWTMESMAVHKSIAMHVDWPEMSLDVIPKEQMKDKSKWKSPEDLAKERRKEMAQLENFFLEAGAYIKARDLGTNTDAHPTWEAMRGVLKGQIPVVVRADDLRAITAAVQWAKTNQLRLVISGGRDAAAAASLLASNHVPVIYEHVFDRTLRDTESYDHLFRTPAVLHKAGVLVALSAGIGDMAETDIRNLGHHAAQAVAFGLDPEEAVRCITINPARIYGLGDQIGTIEKGKNATLIATDGDVLDLRTRVRRLWIAGRPSSLETRHTRLYEKYRNRPAAR